MQTNTHSHAEDTELTSEYICALVDEARAREQLGNIHRYYESRKLKITVMDEINKKLLCTGIVIRPARLSRYTVTNILLNFIYSTCFLLTLFLCLSYITNYTNNGICYRKEYCPIFYLLDYMISG